ncbi:hypothetical protein Tsubulata_016120 [Turnera subulata]|uniref:Cytochrome P450 n=1 Tax=Turnera subulata TaxID=218843 RepID=A0A9Q0JR42_9ROSI|nr:hypothetical protein Tsubulata_016120 [Turnera subulata]
MQWRSIVAMGSASCGELAAVFNPAWVFWKLVIDIATFLGWTILVLFVAGTDGTVTALEWALSHLVNSSRVLKKAQMEIDIVVGNDRLIDESDLRKLPYLQSIITEALRMHPPSPLLLPHESSEECIVGGFRVPRGTMLHVNAWAIQNDPHVWADPTEFRPERFQEMEEAKDGIKFLPFGYGRRSCPGEGMTLRMLGLALGSLIQFFEWESFGEKIVDMNETSGFTAPKLKPLKVLCRCRPSMLNLLSRI